MMNREDHLQSAIARLPRIALGVYPTPLDALPRLTAALAGPALYMKRDDLTGLAFGGNKTRMLEFSLADALQKGADTVVTGMAAQSNYCRQMAAACARLGLDLHLVLRPVRTIDRERRRQRNPRSAAQGNKAMNILLQDVVKRFGALEAVSHVSLDIRDGELFTLLGPSGCGKTTILRLVGGFHRADHGRVLFGEKDMTGKPPYERNIGMVFQNYALWPHMRIFDNIAYGLKLQKFSSSEIRDKVAHAMGLVNMKGLEERYPGELSGGQQQRVALARALVLNPDVLLLDEPLSNLDAKIRIQVRAEIRKLQKDLAITTIYVTHDQEEALTLSDRIAVLSHGKLQQVGSPHELYEKPSNPFVADFIGINNLIPGKITDVLQGGATLRVESAVGTLIGAGDGRLTTNQACMVCVRPETASIGPENGPTEGLNRVSATVSFPSYIGNTVRYDVDMGGTLFKVDVQNPTDHRELPIGAKVTVSFPVSSSLVIPAE